MQRNCREAKSSKSGQKASQKVKKKSPAGKHRPSTAPTPTKGDKQVKRDAKSSRKPEKLDSSKVNRPNKNHLGDVYRDLYPEYLDTMFALIEKGFFWSHAADDDVSMEWDVARASPSTEPTMAWLQKDHQNVEDNVFESSAMLDDGEEFPVVELPSDAIFQSSLEEASRQECSPGLRTSAASLPGVDPGIVHAEMTGVLSDEEEGGAHLMDDTLTIGMHYSVLLLCSSDVPSYVCWLIIQPIAKRTPEYQSSASIFYKMLMLVHGKTIECYSSLQRERNTNMKVRGSIQFPYHNLFYHEN